MENVVIIENELNRFQIQLVSVDPWRTSDKVVLSYPIGSYIYDFENLLTELDDCDNDEFTDYVDLFEHMLPYCYGNVGSIFYNPSI